MRRPVGRLWNVVRPRSVGEFVAQALGYLLAGLVLWPAYHSFLEDASAVWVSTTEPLLETPVMTAFVEDRIDTLWYGYRRRGCDNVEWHYQLFNKQTGKKVWRGRSQASSTEASVEAEEPPEYSMPFPAVPPGTYRYVVLEVAKCNPWKTWTNKMAEWHIEVRSSRPPPPADD